jgi:cell division septal protein FtsQ
VRLGDAQFLERLESYLDLAPTLRERVPDIDYVDLRFGERVYVGSQVQAPPSGPSKLPASAPVRRGAGTPGH